jgi:hypothetical protein
LNIDLKIALGSPQRNTGEKYEKLFGLNGRSRIVDCYKGWGLGMGNMGHASD